jgi:myosin-1
VFSPDATDCKFTCLPKEAAQSLKNTGDVPFRYIKNRRILQGSLQQLLYGSAEGTDSFKDLTEANFLRKKLEFVISIILGWVSGGGLGCLEEPRKFKWDGPQLEDGKRQDWVTVGRFGGDVVN